MPVISLPTPGATAGPAWASQLNTAINAVNTATDSNTSAVATKANASHTHTAADLPPVQPAVSDWDFRLTSTNWNGPIGSRLTIPTNVSPAGGQTTHPSVVFIPEGWNGYRYWMAHTPYPGGNDDFEDPNLAVSQDGITWIAAPGVTQPLDDADGTPEYNSDVDLVMGPGGRMYLFWRFYDSSLGSNQEKAYVRSSTDGVTWTTKALVYQFTESTRRPLSPAFVYEGGKWVMWAVDIHTPATPVLMRMQTSGVDPTAGWGTPVDCTISAVPSGKVPWHVEIRRLGGQYVGLLTVADSGTSGANGQIILITSTDGLAWTGGTTTIIPTFQSGEHDALYRATFIPEINEGVMALRVWYSAFVTATNVWNIYRTLVKANVSGTAPFAQAAGTVTGIGSIATLTGVTTAVTFPVGRFTQAPIVQVTTFTSSRLTVAINVAPTTSGFSARLENWTSGTASGTIGFYWTAIQMTSGSADG